MATDTSPGKWESVFAWGNPPAESAQPRAHSSDALAARLRTNPGHWARVGRYSFPASAQQRARDIEGGIPLAFRPHGAYQARSVGTEVWARYREEAADEANDEAWRLQAAWETDGNDGEAPEGWKPPGTTG